MLTLLSGEGMGYYLIIKKKLHYCTYFFTVKSVVSVNVVTVDR